MPAIRESVRSLKWYFSILLIQKACLYQELKWKVGFEGYVEIHVFNENAFVDDLKGFIQVAMGCLWNQKV